MERGENSLAELASTGHRGAGEERKPALDAGTMNKVKWQGIAGKIMERG